MHEIHEGAPVTCAWESAHVERGQFVDGRLVLVVGLVPMQITYETADRIIEAIKDARPDKLSCDLEASLRQAVERNRRAPLELVK